MMTIATISHIGADDPKTGFASVMAQDLRAAEHHLDDTLSQLGQGLTNMVTGRRQAGFAAQAGQKGLEHYGQAVTDAIAARASLVAAHNSFARDAKRMGVAWTMGGPTESKPLETEADSPYPKRG